MDEQIKDTPDEFANSPAADPAEDILRRAPELTDQMRETLWNVYHSKSTPEELAKVLEHFSASSGTKHKLWEAKKMTAPEIDPVEKVRKAIEGVSQMDPATLKIAEAHPVALKAMVDAVTPKSKVKS